MGSPQSPTPAQYAELENAGRLEELHPAKPVTIANGRITWRNADDNLQVSLEVTNIFDKYYFVNRFDLRGVGAGALVGQLGRPREWALTVKKEF